MCSESTRSKAREVRIVGNVFQKHTLNQNETLNVVTEYMRDPTSISMAYKEAQILDLYSDGGQTIPSYGDTASTSHHIKIIIKIKLIFVN